MSALVFFHVTHAIKPVVKGTSKDADDAQGH